MFLWLCGDYYVTTITSNVGCPEKGNLWRALHAWKKQATNININETNNEILLGLNNPNNDINLNFLNFANLCAKNYIRENEGKVIYFIVYLKIVKDMIPCIKNKEVKEMFDELL